jgi:hypothetical protein
MGKLSALLMPNNELQGAKEIQMPNMNNEEHLAYQEHVKQAKIAGELPLTAEEFRMYQQK